MTVRDWINMFEIRMEEYGVSRDLWISIAVGFLRDEPLSWWRTVIRRPGGAAGYNWHSFCQALQQSFDPLSRRRVWDEAVRTWGQKQGERVSKYHRRFMREIVEDSPTVLSQSRLHEIYYRGLMAPFRPHGSPATFESLTSIRDVAMRLERQYIDEMGAYVDDFRAGSDTPTMEDTSEEEDDPDEDDS